MPSRGTADGNPVTERRASLVGLPLAAWERDGLSAALSKAGLPAEDIDAPNLLFWRFESGDVPVGFGGLDIHGDQALLRSVVTLPPVRRRGIGRAIVAMLEMEARVRHCRAVWLLAPAPEFFLHLGYRPCERRDVPKAIQETAQFARLCPASAVPLVKHL